MLSDQNGKVAEITPIPSPDRELTQYVSDIISEVTFNPGKCGDEPVDMYSKFVMTFTIDRTGSTRF